MKFRMATNGEKKHSVRYDEDSTATDKIVGIYIPKTRLLKLTGGKADWPQTLTIGDPEIPAATPVTNLRRRA